MKKITVYLCMLLSCISVQAQQDSTELKLASFVKNIQLFNHLYPQEKVYLHFDNTGYFQGETIWFKAYISIAEQNKPTVLSRVLYVELLTPEGNIVETKKLKIENGQCNGSFLLPRTQIPAGFYEVRAYTRMMLNQEETVFSRVFPVYNTPNTEGDYSSLGMTQLSTSRKPVSKREKEEKQKNPNITFYPEGGYLVNGITSQIAFKVTNSAGQNLDVTGTVKNGQKEIITSFSTTHDGMGEFSFCPDSTPHSVSITYEGKEYPFDLPEAKPTGIILNVNSMRDDFVLVGLQKSTNFPTGMVGLTSSCRGKVSVFETIDLSSQNEFLLKIPKTDLLSGVNQMTLFNVDGEILAERLVFINQGECINILPIQKTTELKPYGAVDLSFETKDQTGRPVRTVFSLSVRDAQNELYSAYTDNIMTNMLLSSDIKGYIENVGYYFESDDNTHKMALDLLMMTQGWKRYSWQQMAGVSPYPARHKIEKGIVIDGQVLSAFRKKPKENVEVKMWMYSDNGAHQQGLCITDKDGKFNFLPNDFDGEWKLTIQTKEEDKKKENYVLLDRVFAPQPRPYTYFDTQWNVGSKDGKDSPLQKAENTTDETNNKSIKDTHQLPEVQIKGKTILDGNARVTTHDIDKEVEALEDQGENYSVRIIDFLRQVDGNFSYDLSITSDPSLSMNSIGRGIQEFYTYKYKGKPARIIVDDNKNSSVVPNELLASDIKEVIITEKPGANFMLEPNPSISDVLIRLITSKEPKYITPLGIRKTKLYGFSKVDEFFNPDYQNGALPDERDFRRTLYWNPNVKTDLLGKASVSFYNNGTCKKLSISAEILTSEGTPGILKK